MLNARKRRGGGLNRFEFRDGWCMDEEGGNTIRLNLQYFYDNRVLIR